MKNTLNLDIQAASPNGLFNENDSCTKEHTIVYFDLETSGRCKYHEILQIAAIYDEKQFNIYVTPTNYISLDASIVNGMENRDGVLFVRDVQVNSVPIIEALEQFRQFLISSNKCNILAAHNSPFDIRFLLRAFEETDYTESFRNVICGVVNTLPLFRIIFPSDERHALEYLAENHLNDIVRDNFHDGIYDVIVLQKLVQRFIPEVELIEQYETYEQLLEKKRKSDRIAYKERTLRPLEKYISKGMITKLAKFDFDYDKLSCLYNDYGENAVVEKLCGGPKKDRIIHRKYIIDAIISHFKAMKELREEC